VFEALLNLMSRALEGLSALPWGVHLLVALFMAVGLVLWLAGERFIKPVVILAAALIGGLVGALIIPSTGWGASFSIWHAIGIGLISGTVVGLLLFRSAMAVGFGVVLGALFPLIAASALQASSTQTAHAAPLDTWHSSLVRFDAADSAAQAGLELDIEKVPPNLRPAAERISHFWGTFSQELSSQWQTLPAPHRGIILMAAALGLATGVICGLSMPKWASGGVSAMFGAGLWLPAFVWLSNALQTPWRTQLDLPPLHWLGVWGVVALLGMIAQWSGILGKKQKKPAAKPAAAPAPA
jgi:hypothetical protein